MDTQHAQEHHIHKPTTLIDYQKGYIKVCVPLHSEDEDTTLRESKTHLATYSHPATMRDVTQTTTMVQTRWP